MKIAIFYFSGTGNTWWVTEKIRTKLIEKENQVDVYSIERNDLEWNILIPNILKSKDLIGIGYPLYSSNIPGIMKSWIKNNLCISFKK